MEQKKEHHLLESLRKGYALPPMSPIGVKLMELASEDDTSVEELVKLIEKDPSLSTQLLKLANSAFFRTVYPVSSIKQAVVKIGYRHLRIMALSVSVCDAFPMGRKGALDYEEFWRLSLYRALIAKHLAKELGNCSPEEAFVAALIMEIGLLVFFDFYLKNSSEPVDIQLTPIEELMTWEKRMFGVNHRQVGECVLRYWSFPESIIQCQQASRDTLMDEESDPLIRTCELARILSQIISSEIEEFDTLYQITKNYFGLEYGTLHDILLSTFEIVAEMAAGFKIQVNRDADLLRILEKANRTLSRISDKITIAKHSEVPNELPIMNNVIRTLEIKEQILQAVAHEIRNPLTVIGGFARRLLASTEKKSGSSQYAHIIVEEAKRLENLLGVMTGDQHVDPRAV